MAEQLDMAAIMPAEKVVSAVARSVTMTESDSGKSTDCMQSSRTIDFQLPASATVQVNKPQCSTSKVESEATEQINEDDDDDDSIDEDNFWHTSVGKFKFSLDGLPQTLQFIHSLLTEMSNIEKPDILYYMLTCMNVLALHGDALTEAARDHRGFFIWCQENLLIKK